MTAALLAFQDAAQNADRTPLIVVGVYLVLLLVMSVLTSRGPKGSSSAYFVAGRSIGPFLLLMSVFGTTMTAFALVGSTGKAFQKGIGVYGLMASTSGIVHSLVFFLVGIKLWAIGKRHDYVTQIQFFRARFDSNLFGTLLFPVLVLLVIPYLLIGVVGAGVVMQGITKGMFPETFPMPDLPNGRPHPLSGSVPPWLSGLVVCCVVLFYILRGGVKAAALANAVQTLVFMAVGVLAFVLIANSFGGLTAASEMVAANEKAAPLLARELEIGHLEFLSYAFVPLSVGMFPHLFQHWLTARNAKAFRMTCVAHPLFIMVVWLPCVLIGVWAAGADIKPPGGSANAVLSAVVAKQLSDPWIMGLLTAGILAAIMSSLDSQFVCLGSMFTHDVVLHHSRPGRFTDEQTVLMGRLFIVAIVAVTYVLSLFKPPHVFDLAVWCFSGFAALFPIVFASIYWRRVTRAGATACLIVTAGVWFWLFYDGLLGPALAGKKSGEEYLIGGMMPVTLMFAASALTLVGVSLVTSPPPKHVVDRFFDRPAA